jgi:hypothetical protein
VGETISKHEPSIARSCCSGLIRFGRDAIHRV